MAPSGYAAYRRAAVSATQSKEKMLLMLYEGAARFLRFARTGVEEKSAKIRGENISKVIAILTELDCALDRAVGGELVDNLSDLYRYMIDRLTHANVKNYPEDLDEVERLLIELKEGFEGAFENGPKEASLQPESEEPGTQGGIRVAV